MRRRDFLQGIAAAGAFPIALLQHPSTAQAQNARFRRGLTVLHFFRGYEGNMPATSLLPDGEGGFFSTSNLGGGGNPGTIFRMSPPVAPEKRWSVERLLKFNDASTGDGNLPSTTLVPDAKGNLFGTTFRGGNGDRGTVYILKPPGAGETEWKRRIIHTFAGAPGGGERPMGQLFLTEDGSLLGTTYLGGAFDSGTIFMLTPPASGNVWNFTLIRSLRGNGVEGGFPQAGLIVDTKGVYYGTTTRGGTSDRGTIFSLVETAPGVWKYKTLFHFPDNGTPNTGGVPLGNLLLLKGALYGTTSFGGVANLGTVFRLAREGEPKTWQHTELHAFGTTVEDGFTPEAGVIGDRKGALYGVTKLGGPTNHGVIFKLSPPADEGDPWTEAILHSFSGADGSQPVAELIRDADGIFFGTASGGGKYNRGTAFALRP